MKIALCIGVLLLALIFLIPQNANAVTINAVPRTTTFGPNDWINVDVNIQGYTGGTLNWVAHRPDNSTVSGSFQSLSGGKVAHQIIRSAYDNYFGNWTISYTYNNVTKPVFFKVLPLKLIVTNDKELYYGFDTMKINITTSYYIPVAPQAEFFHLNFYDDKGNLVKDTLQIDIRAVQPNTVYNFPLLELAGRNPPGLYKFKVQYYNVFAEVPFLIGDISKYMSVSVNTDKPVYNLGDSVNLNMLFTNVRESEGALKITDPSGNTITTTFPVNSISTTVHLQGAAALSGKYYFTVQYAGVLQSGSFIVTTSPTIEPNVGLAVFLDKLKYRPGEMLSLKIHVSNIIADHSTYWFEDPNKKQTSTFSIPVTSLDTIIPHMINKNDVQGMWKMYVRYGNTMNSATFFVQGSLVDNTNMFYNANTTKLLMTVDLSSAGMKKPRAIAVDSMYNIYVADYETSQIKKFDSSGKLLLSWGSYGSANVQFIHPSGIFVNQKYVYVADSGNARIQVFDKNGTFVYAFGAYGDTPGMFHVPGAIATDSIGDLYISDSDADKIVIFNKNGQYKNEIHPFPSEAANFSSPSSIAFDSKDNFYVVSKNNKVLKYSDIGDFVNFFGSFGDEEGRFNNPTSISVDSNDNFYVADTNNYRIQKFDSGGTFLFSWGSLGTNPSQFKEPVGLAMDSMNNLYVVDEANNNIQKFATNIFSSQLAMPSWVKNNAKLWAEGVISDSDFENNIAYAIKQGASIRSNQSFTLSYEIIIPSWVKNNAKWWVDGLISDKEFFDGIQYLFAVKIIKI